MQLINSAIYKLVDSRKYPRLTHFLFILSNYFALTKVSRTEPVYPGELYHSYPDAMEWSFRTPLFMLNFTRNFPRVEDTSLHSGWQFGLLPNPIALFTQDRSLYYFYWDKTKVSATKEDIRNRRIALEV